MDFNDFSKRSPLFYTKQNNPSPELTAAFYMDCFVDHQLQELLYPMETKELSEGPEKDLEKDFDDMISKLINRIPSYNKPSKKSKGKYAKIDSEVDMEEEREIMINKCKKWFFSIIYCKNPDMCKNLAPIIAFILIDSYPYLEKVMKKKRQGPQFDLYKHIIECINGKYQDAYLFSLLRNSPPSQKKGSIKMGEDELQKILRTSFKLLMHTYPDPSTAETNGDKIVARTKSHMYLLWSHDIVFGCRYEGCLSPLHVHIDMEDGRSQSYTYENMGECIAKNFFFLFQDMNIQGTLSSNKTRRASNHHITPKIWDDLLDFDHIASEQLDVIRSLQEKSPDGKRTSYDLSENDHSENLISLICYLNDLERENFFDKKYDRALIIYTLNKMTQWVTPFTTSTIQNHFPAYNPAHVFTCHCYNHIYDGYCTNDFRWNEIDFEVKLGEGYRDKTYKEFKSWYDGASPDEQKTFNDQLIKYTKEIFFSFIYCPDDYIYFPTNKQTIERKDPFFSSKEVKTECLAFFYCICDRFYYHIGPQINESFREICEKWLCTNDIWSELKNIFDDVGLFCVHVNSKEYSGERSSKRLTADLEQTFGRAFGRYLGEHLDEFMDEYWTISIGLDEFGGRLILENFDEILKEFKRYLSEDPKRDHLCQFIP